MRDIFEELARIHRDGGAVAVATVIGTLGSTPGKSTMKMLVRPDGSFLGTVGGGCVEAEVLERSLRVIATEKAERFVVELNEDDNPETGLVCGGKIEIFIEPVAMPNVFVFGAGHVARAVCAIAAPAGFRVVVVDDRPQFPTPERFPLAADRFDRPWDDVIACLPIDATAFVLVMTRGHKDDMTVLRALHRAGAAPRYLGLIGSKSKLLVLKKHLLGEGISAAFLDRVRTPIGLPIGARSAEEIAISVMAELVRIRRLGDDAPGTNGAIRGGTSA